MTGEAEIDEQMKKWRQGDVILGVELPFLHAFDAHQPLTDESKADVADEPPAERNPDFRLIGIEVKGFAVLTQTCDLVRQCSVRPYVELAPLVEIADEDIFNSVKGAHRPSYAYLRPIEDQKLLVDLDRVMTVEKSVLAKVPDACRIVGCETDKEKRDFVRALERKRSRFAFPADFGVAAAPIRKRVKRWSGKDSDEGQFIDAVREIRVKAEPDWNNEDRDLTFYFIFPENVEILGPYHQAARNLIQRFKTKDGKDPPEFGLLSITAMSAALYLSTDKLDFDDLSD